MGLPVDALANLLPAAMNVASAAVSTPLPGAFGRLVQSLLASPGTGDDFAAPTVETSLPDPAPVPPAPADLPALDLLAELAGFPFLMPQSLPPAADQLTVALPAQASPTAPRVVIGPAPSELETEPSAVEPAGLALPRADLPVLGQPAGVAPAQAAASYPAAAEVESPVETLPVAFSAAVPIAPPAREQLPREVNAGGAEDLVAPSSPFADAPSPRTEGRQAAAPPLPARGPASADGESPPRPVFEPPLAGTEPSSHLAGVVRFDGNAPRGKTTPAITLDEAPVARPSSPAEGQPVAATQAAVDNRPLSATVEATAAPATPARVAELPPAVHQLGRAVLEKTADGGGEARIRLDPPELGSVTVHVRLHGDAVQVDVHAERPEALQFLREHSPDLSNLLGQHGLDLAGLSVGLDARQGSGAGAGQGYPYGFSPRPPPGDFAAVMGVEASAPTRGHQQLAAANPDGQHLYRV